MHFDTGPKGLFNVANLFTIIRIPLGIWGIVLYESGNEVAGLIVIVLAALTDLADGWVARNAGCQSQFGEVLDPTVDKIGMVIIGLWSLTQVGDALILVILILLMELLTAIQTLYALTKGVQIMTHMIGKWGITFRAFAVLMFLIASNGSGGLWGSVFLLGCVGFFLGYIFGWRALGIYHKQLQAATT